MSRASARDQALGALYAADMTGSEPITTGLSGRAKRFVEGTWADRQLIDSAIAAAATGWRIERMPAVDRNIIRLALHELRLGDTPVGVVISEAVNMAKRFSTERSGAFVNGVLSRLVEEAAAK
ncbi:MAG: transcription antitermination factor NusB [bacterium]|nr:transcription antitermination factor NusB [bacterium]MCP4968286.1 transcription antitermination factor NusB [bacterium]